MSILDLKGIVRLAAALKREISPAGDEAMMILHTRSSQPERENPTVTASKEGVLATEGVRVLF